MKHKDVNKVIKELVLKINQDEIELSEVGSMINKFDDNADNKQLTDYIKSKIQECVIKDDLIQALAIVDYSLHNTCVGYEGLKFIYNDDTYLSGYDDFAIEFIGHCEALHYI